MAVASLVRIQIQKTSGGASRRHSFSGVLIYPNTSNTNSRKCANTFVNQKPNPVRVLNAQNGVAILCFGITPAIYRNLI
jgi:hypothetical protein